MDRRSGRSRAVKPGIEGMEGRQLLSTVPGTLALVGATTTDSQSVTVTYELTGGPLEAPVALGVYRSTDPQWGPEDTAVATVPLGPGLAEGTHTVTLPLPEGLPLQPARPHVLVVADPARTSPDVDPARSTADFEKHSVAIITHGGMQSKGASRGPWWQRRMAQELESQGYDNVVPFVWASQSRTPGSMQKQVPRLVKTIQNAVSAFQSKVPVDVHVIGHSEGAILDSLALQRLADTGTEPAAMTAGFTQVTMLDPHAASTGIQGQQYSSSNGVFGSIAKLVIDQYQSSADDPPPFVPSNAEDADVFFQRTHVSEAQSNRGWYNLWGQVPVLGEARYFDLTGPGLSHSGRFGVYDWYIGNVVPTLGEGAPFLKENELQAELVTPPTPGLTDGGFRHVIDHQLVYQGHAAPGSTIKLMGARPGVSDLDTIARTTADANGDWTAVTRSVYSGLLRVVAVATSDVDGPRTGRRMHFRPITWVGNVLVDHTRPRNWASTDRLAIWADDKSWTDTPQGPDVV